MNRYPQGWLVGHVEKIPAAGGEHAIIRQRRVETAITVIITTALAQRNNAGANTQEDVLSPNESQAIRGRFIEVWARGANGISPGTKKFFCKNVFHTKATPLCGQNHFWASFWERGR